MKKALLTLGTMFLALFLYAQDWNGVEIPATPPTDYEWELQSISDGFNYESSGGNRPSEFTDRWNDTYINGFSGPSATSYHKDHSWTTGGYLNVHANWDANMPIIYTGCISSKETFGYPMFMESKVKLSNCMLANNVWMISTDETEELDMLESYPNSQTGREWLDARIHLSHHTFIRDPFTDYQPRDEEGVYGTWYHEDGRTTWRDDWVRIGVYWVNPHHVEYYINGRWVRTIKQYEHSFLDSLGNVSTHTTTFDAIDKYGYTGGTGLSKPMHIIINMEQQSWLSDLNIYPTQDELKDENGKNIYLVDWIRVYKAVPIGGGVPVTGVEVSPISITLNPGQTYDLDHNIIPSNATNQIVTWTTSNPTIATVNGAGVVTAVAQGTVTAEVVTNDGGFKGICTVTVTGGSGDIPVTGVTLSPTSASIVEGSTHQLTAVVSPSNATNKSVTWSSNNTSVATVNGSGVVTGESVGNATITVKTVDGGKIATSAITVTGGNNGGGTTITIEAETFTDHGGTYNDGHVPVGVNNGGNKINWVNSGDWAEYNINVTDAGEYSIQYMISTPENNAQIQIAFNGTTASTDNVVNNGQWDSYQALNAANNVTLSTGSHTVRVTASGSNTWQWNLDKITLTKVGDGGGDVPVTGVTVSPTNITLTTAGATQDLAETVAPSNATNKTVSWSSSNNNVATVNGNGLVTAVANGNATITVTTADGGFKANTSVTISISTGGQEPYPNGIAHAIPGTIESVNFDDGGEGVAYHDATSGNSGSGPRQDQNVDTEYRIAAGNVGWIAAGEWLEYTVNVSQTGTYKFEIMVASTGNNGAYHIEFNGVDKTGRQSVSATGGWGTFVTQTISGVSLNAGQQVMRVYMDGGSFNLGTMSITSDGGNNPICDVPWSGPDYSVSKATNNWTSETIDISCIDNAYISMTAEGVGPMENADYLNIYYTVDGGSRVAMLQNTNTLGSRTVSADNVNGNSLQIIIEGKTSWADETYTVNNISVIDSKLKNSVGQMEDAIAMDALIYPNPVRDELNVELASEVQDNATISIYNTIGTLVLTQNMESNFEYISVQSLSDGMYILRINNGTEVVIKRFIKE